MLPQVDLPEILLEVHSWTGFLDAYSHISGAGPRMKHLPLSVAAVLIAEACNVGLIPVIGVDTFRRTTCEPNPTPRPTPF